MESRRTSPAANTPGTLVSNAYGARLSGQGTCSAAPAVNLARSGPVTTYPRSSRATSLPQPVGARLRADEDEQPARRDVFAAAVGAVEDRQRLEVAVAARCRHLARGAHLDVGRGVDAVDEVARHRGLEAARTHQHHHAPRVLGHVEGGLARGVGGADDVDVVVDDLTRVAGVGAVVDAAAGEVVDALRLEPPVGDAGGHDHRAGLDRRADRLGRRRARPRGPARAARARPRRGPAPSRRRTAAPGPSRGG